MTAHVVDRLSAYLDGELTVADAAAVRQHLAACAACEEELAVLAAVDRRLRERSPSAPAGYFDSFSARVRGRIEADRAPRKAFNVPAWTWAVAAALLLAVVLPRMPWDEGGRSAAPAERPAPPGGRAETAPSPAATAPQDERPREEPAAVSPGLVRDQAQPRQRSAPSAAPRATTPPAPAFARAPAAPPATTATPPEAKLESAAHLAEELVGAERRAAAKELRPSARPDSGVDSLGKRDDAHPEAADHEPSTPAAAALGAPHPAAERGRAARSMADLGPKKAQAAEFERLRGQPASSLEEARALRESLRSFVSRHPGTLEAAEARVLIVGLGVDIAARTGSAQDAEDARRDGEVALAHGDARQKQRVRSLLGQPPRE